MNAKRDGDGSSCAIAALRPVRYRLLVKSGVASLWAGLALALACGSCGGKCGGTYNCPEGSTSTTIEIPNDLRASVRTFSTDPPCTVSVGDGSDGSVESLHVSASAGPHDGTCSVHVVFDNGTELVDNLRFKPSSNSCCPASVFVGSDRRYQYTDGGQTAPRGPAGSFDAGARDASSADAPVVDATPLAASSTCDKLPCFSACGAQIAVAPIEPPTGFVAAPSPSSLYEAQPLGPDWVLALGRALAEVRKMSDLSLIGSAPLPATWGYTSAVVGNLAFVRDQNANQVVLELENLVAPRAVAWWVHAGHPVGSWRGKLVLAVGTGVSFVDVSNPLSPVELFCLSGVSDRVWIAGDTLVRERSEASSTYADAYHLGTTAPWASIKVNDSQPAVLDGTRLATSTTKEVVLYELGGTAPVQVARTELTYPYRWAEAGFFFERSADQSSVIALDLRGALERYAVSQVAGNACLNRLDALDSSRAFVVSDWLPGARFAPDSLPAVQCPVVDPVNDARGVAALSPDGHTLLLNAPPNLVFRDLDTGKDTTVKATVGLPDALAWIGDRIVAVTSSYALDYFTAWATILDVANPQGAPATVSGLRPHTFWLGTSGGRLVGFESGSGSTNNPTLWLVDPQANTAVAKDIVLPQKFATMAQLWNDKFVAFSDTEAIVFNLDGVEQMRLSLPPSIAAAKSRFLSNLGWFATSNAGELLRFDPALGIVEVVVANCIQCQLLGADNQRVYVQAFGPEALGPLLPPPEAPLGDFRKYANTGYTELRAYAATGSRYPLVGRYPLPDPDIPTLLIGSKLALVANGALILAAP